MSSESGTDPRKRTRKAVSIYNRLSGTQASIQSRTSSTLSKLQRDMMGIQYSKTLRCREWLLVTVEFLLGFSWNCFLAREKSQKTMEMRGVTPLQDSMETLFLLGWASIGSIIVGQLMDSIIGYYFMALLNIIIHFSMASLFLIGEIVYETSSEDVYIYAMDQAGGQGGTFIIHYTFIFYILSLIGNMIFTVLNDYTPSSALLSAIAFCFNGTALFLFVFMLRPRPRMSPPPPGLALKVWGVIFTALRNRRKLGKKILCQDWLDYAENKYDKGQIIKTRRLFTVFLVVSPTAGFLLFTKNENVIFKEFYDNLKLSGIGVPKYLKWIVSTTALLVVICVEYLLIPLLQACKFKVNFLKRFFLGYISLVSAVIAAAVLTTLTEKLPIRGGFGTFRVYNTKMGNVSFASVQQDFTQVHFVVLEKEYVMANFQANEQNLFRMAVTFATSSVGRDTDSNETSYTQLFSVSPEEVLQYVTITPSTVIRVPGFLPIKQGPPGTNNPLKPRCFMVSLIRDRTQSVYVTNEKTGQRIILDIEPGKVITFQVDEGEYALNYAASVNPKVTAMLGSGGLYGIYLFLNLEDYEIDVDMVVKENTLHAMTALAVAVPMLIARGIGEVALDAFVYNTAPSGLKGLGFGFYMCCSHLTSWIILIGFHTWHHYITPNIIVDYAVMASIGFIICLVLLIRYRTHYTM